MWSAQAVRDLKIDHTYAIYPPCTEPEARNSAVGWHWNTHIIFVKESEDKGYQKTCSDTVVSKMCSADP